MNNINTHRQQNIYTLFWANGKTELIKGTTSTNALQYDAGYSLQDLTNKDNKLLSCLLGDKRSSYHFHTKKKYWIKSKIKVNV